MSKLLLLLSITLISTTAYAQKPTCDKPTGEWVNDLKSTLIIKSVDTSGLITGQYSSPSGTAGEYLPLTGWFNAPAPSAPNLDNGKIISFSVNWGKYGSVTSWSGICQVVNGKPTIATIWNLARANSQFSWDHIVTNTDKFTPK